MVYTVDLAVAQDESLSEEEDSDMPELDSED